ncbi:MAG: SycD/LcrH family type III secretion system chaperone [Parachlamydiaceae bacterium]
MVNSATADRKETKQLIQQALEKVKDGVPSTFLPMIEEALLKIELEGLSPAEAMGISQELIEEIYENGYHFFQSGKFKDALVIFNFLTQLAGGNDPRFTFAIAAAHHHLKNYNEAVGYYMLYEMIHPASPLPYYHLYDCFKKMGNPELALAALMTADKIAGDNPAHAGLKAKIEVELKHQQSSEEEEKV